MWGQSLWFMMVFQSLCQSCSSLQCYAVCRSELPSAYNLYSRLSRTSWIRVAVMQIGRAREGVVPRQLSQCVIVTRTSPQQCSSTWAWSRQLNWCDGALQRCKMLVRRWGVHAHAVDEPNSNESRALLRVGLTDNVKHHSGAWTGQQGGMSHSRVSSGCMFMARNQRRAGGARWPQTHSRCITLLLSLGQDK